MLLHCLESATDGVIYRATVKLWFAHGVPNYIFDLG